MTIDSLHPFAGDHSVQNVAFVLEWATPLDKATLEAIKRLAPQFRASFPVVQEQQLITVNVEAPKQGGITRHHRPKAPPTPATQLGGIQFLHVGGASAGSFTRMIQVQRDSCLVALNEYSRWDVVWPKVHGWLEVVLPVILTGRSLNSFTLQYQDLFLWKDDPNNLQLREIFESESNFLPSNIFELRSAWHSHHGYVEPYVGNWAGHLLNNVNVNVGDLNGVRQIGTMLTHKVTFGAPIWSLERATAALGEVMPALHQVNKSILSGLFAEEVRNKIGLTAPRGE
ncbi:TIGR04255 family protein, partial [Burkholderia gladioli]|uniref:TIGR04255 family protein n=1 Tax=Burkholderia gladioli TaxID=28095 RepID=UPI0016404266|nr:TIGR04255 family protein [Burkholderia gladioli]MDR8090330.1 TIGR04255 family protein [Burkholderia gladioli]